MEEMNKNILFSIIIPVQKINDYVIETCGVLEKIEKENFEIIIFPDELEGNNSKMEQELNARIIATGKVSPAVKRDLAMKYAKGEYLAFTDDDAYPEKDWLGIAAKYLKDNNVAAVGGPQLTPPSNDFWQKVSGAMFLSPLSGSAIIRYWPGKKAQEIDDWPTVNFIVKKKDFEAIDGFDNEYWPGEDTKLCLDIIKKLKKKIIYIPELIVYHHRRAGLKKHLKQTGGYGLHRGYFAKVFPETSMRFFYLVPSLFVLFLVIGLIGSFFSGLILKLFLLGILIYGLAVFFSTLIVWKRTKDFLVSLMTIPYLVLFHVWYGIRFIQGYVFTKKLKSKLGK